MKRSPTFALTLLCMLVCQGARAEEVYIPEVLREWEPWVLHGEEHVRCPFVTGGVFAERAAHICAWPGELDLRIGQDGGNFSQRWRVFEISWIPLPGDGSHWPQGVSVDREPVPVVVRNGIPQIRLTPGAHRVAGRFRWSTRPEVLGIPARIGIIRLRIDGQAIAFPGREGGRLWLGEREGAAADQEDHVNIVVHRLLRDGVPQLLDTRIQLEVSGRAREEQFEDILPETFVPTAIASSLPVKMDLDGGLTAQVRPGAWLVTMTARAGHSLEEITPEATGTAWPGDEIWSYRSNDRLRVTVAEGGSPVDPVQVGVPGEWRQYPSFRLGRGESLRIIERVRGQSERDANRLTMGRQLWLDFDGGGFTARDSVEGTMRRGWRLDLAPPYELTRATQQGENLLITHGAETGELGVELRSPVVALDALSRIASSAKRIPVTGWTQSFAGVDTTLHLPPGRRLFAAVGADSAPGAWISGWTVWDLFLVLIIAAAVWKLTRPALGVLGLFVLILTYQEPGAPLMLWLNLLAAMALAQVLPVGRLKGLVTTYRNLSLAVVVIVAIPFVANQARYTIYPQLEPATPFFRALPATAPSPAPMYEVEPADQAADLVTPERRELREQIAVVSEEDLRRPAYDSGLALRYAPGVLVQTGPGLPSWRWHTYALAWGGPVDPDQSVRLVIMPPWIVALWRVVGLVTLVLLIAGLAAACLGLGPGIGSWRERWRRLLRAGGQAAALAMAATVAASLTFAPEAQTQDVDPALLQELKARLLEPPACAPHCAEISHAQLTGAERGLEISLEIHALARVAVPLPGKSGHWAPDEVYVDGRAQNELHRDAGDVVWVSIESGRHTVRLLGRLADTDIVQIDFPLRPRFLSAEVDDWEASGLVDNRLVTGSLELKRLETVEDDSEAGLVESNLFPPFVRIDRRLVLDLDWYVETSVFRMAPEQAAFDIEIPLLEGESVTTAGFEIAVGRLLVAMSAGERSVAWRSTLARADTLMLTAAQDAPWTEVWRVAASPVWRVDHEGLPSVAPEDTSAGFWVPEFHPLPGETLTLAIGRPEPVAGPTLAFDRVELRADLGQRSMESSLSLQMRSTRGGQHDLRIPPEAELLQFSVGGRTLAIQPDAGVLPIPVQPGEHAVALRWRSKIEQSARNSTPIVDLGAAASNVKLDMTLPGNRWVLFAFGPRLGPAVLYWTELAVFVVLAWFLGRLPQTPLRFHHWLLLGLGLSTFSWIALALFGAWLFALAWRARLKPPESAMRFNLMQGALALFSVIALGALVSAIPAGLLGAPNMHIVGNGSFGNTLRWFSDRTEGVLPAGGAISIPLWVYKLVILLWALWLSLALLKWLPWAWQCLSSEGLWRGRLALPGFAATRPPRKTSEQKGDEG